MCHNCHTIESIQHIIFNCEANNCSYAWEVVKEICELKHIPWPRDFDITSVMAIPLLKIRLTNNKIRTGATCLFLIAMSECAFLLWKTHCKRLFDVNEESQNKTPSPQETHNHMITILNNRLSHDCILTSWKRYQSQALPSKLVLRTWSGTLRDKPSLPENWLKANGVLVGICHGMTSLPSSPLHAPPFSTHVHPSLIHSDSTPPSPLLLQSICMQLGYLHHWTSLRSTPDLFRPGSHAKGCCLYIPFLHSSYLPDLPSLTIMGNYLFLVYLLSLCYLPIIYSQT